MDLKQINGEIHIPIAGTIRWENGHPSGIWGMDFPCTPHVEKKDGKLRPMTRAERRWLARIERRATK